MPTIRYMSWNIQNFGNRGPKDKLLKGRNSHLLAQFIAAVVKYYNIDILGVMEVKPNSQAILDTLLFALNDVMGPPRDWCYDSIKSTVVADQPATNASPPTVTTPDDLGWKSGARREGYAVYWRNNETAKFKMLEMDPAISEGARRDPDYNPNYMPANALSLSLKGRVIGDDGYLAGNFNAGAPAAGWGDSLFPPTSVGVFKTPAWKKTRRPCYFLIKLNIAGAGNNATLVPVLLYHAPSNQARARLGTFISGLSQQLYAVHDLDGNDHPTGALIAQQKVIASGDYNAKVSNPNIWYSDYYSYYNPFNAILETYHVGGAACIPLNNNTHPNDFRSTVQIKESKKGIFRGPPITSANVADYLFLPIDNMFYRGLPPANAPICFMPNLVDLVMGDHDDVKVGIQAFYNHLDEIRRKSLVNRWRVDPNKGPLDQHEKPIFNFLTDWFNFFGGVRAGNFAHARSAAEFIRMFVSDHFPIVTQFDVA